MTKPGPGRYPYRPIVGRPDYHWPDGKRLALYFGINHEVFAWGGGLGPELAPAQGQPDVMNFAWRDYGARVGAWRLMDLFDELGLATTALLNADVVARCPGLGEACRDRGDDLVAHGRNNAEAQGQLREGAERAMIAEATAALAALGPRPTGWLSPWISEAERTPELLVEAGYRYVLDWAHDDQPTWLATDAGPLLAVPYSQEVNDIPAIVARKQEAETFAAMLEAAVEQLLAECDRRPVVLGVALHPYLMGQAHRVPPLARALRRLRAADDPRIWWTTAGAVADHVLAHNLAI